MKEKRGTYVDGFVMVVPKKTLTAYRRMAKQAGEVWMKHGALDYKECVGDDLNVKYGFAFPKLVKLKKDEVVIFSYIVYKNRAQRDKINAQVMKDPAISDPKYKEEQMPFDMKRVSYGGFKIIVDAAEEKTKGGD